MFHFQNYFVTIKVRGVIQQMQYASLLLRFTARFLDYLIFFFGLAILYFLSTTIFGEWLGPSGKNPGLIAIIFNIVEIALFFLYFIYLPSKNGQTFGAKMVEIKVVNENGKTPSLPKFLLREIVGMLISNLTLLGHLWMLWDRKKQTWHDKIAGTYTVKI